MLNEELVSDLDDAHFVTMILVRINPARNILDYSSAGHIPAYLVNSTGEAIHTLKSTGIPLGFIAGETFLGSEPITLKSGNILALLTDGITEALAKDESEFGHDRMMEVINSHRKDTAQEITNHLNQAVCSFTDQRHQEDDITSVICKVN
jgi:serine phosphatase RsbU (regulator of sigma subunit)